MHRVNVVLLMDKVMDQFTWTVLDVQEMSYHLLIAHITLVMAAVTMMTFLLNAKQVTKL